MDKAGWPIFGEHGVVIGARGMACRVMLDRCILHAWVLKPDSFWSPLVTRELFG